LSSHVIVLAAGQGKRMMSSLAKVAHPVAGKPMVLRVAEAAQSLGAVNIVVVLGVGAETVSDLLPDGIRVAIQEEQLGTADATSVGLRAVEELDDDDTVLVLYGDMPLLTSELVSRLADRSPEVTARMVVTRLEDPTGYGRVIRDQTGGVVAVVEERDCTPEQREITEINAGVYAFEAGELVQALAEVSSDNAQSEFYLTDVVAILVAKGQRVEPVEASPEEVVGINSQDQLAEATRLLHKEVVERLAGSGVWILDPERTYIDDSVKVEPGARIYPGVHLEGTTTVAAGARVGPEVTAIDSQIGANAVVWYAVLRGAAVGEDCEVGPYASLRPGTVLEKGAKLGTFVETKNAHIGEASKANHLSYLGDVTIGRRSNIGAGTITVNYDGVDKNHTVIGDDAAVGSDTMLVAPVRIGDRATTGAGSVITKDVADDALAVERAEQTEIPGYSERREKRKAAKRESEG
jgi:bifunctional UDP-N-acetylglucosamine pyrophosphorylase/glucosamine-1-phosphate N-acetyltransferase